MLAAIGFELAVLGISYAYHRAEAKSLKNKNAAPKPANEISIPRTDDGAPIPLLFGRCRARSPWLAWVGTPSAEANDPEGSDLADGAPFVYRMDMFFILGIPFKNGLCRVWNIWVDDAKLETTLDIGTVTSNDEQIAQSDSTFNGSGFIGSKVQWYDGAISQLFCNPTTPFAAVTEAGQRMATAEGTGSAVPSFRGYLSTFLYGTSGGWFIGNNPSPGAYSFEASSFPSDSLLEINSVGDDDVNPADVIFDLLVATFGKAGLPITLIDVPSFEAAATTLLAEEHGYSRSIEDGETAGDIINEICEQTDGIVRINPTTQKIEYKLIRGDYDPATIPHLTPENVDTLDDYEAGNWETVVNKVRVTFEDRDLDYQENSAPAQNTANANAQVGSPDEQVIRMPGCKSMTLASTLAQREISFLSRPLARCRATASRGIALRLLAGDVCKLSWPEYGVSEMVFRVSKVGRGTLQDGAITLYLMQDVTFIHGTGSFGEIITPTLPPFQMA